MTRSILAAACALAAAACAGKPRRFPQPDEVRELAARPAPEVSFKGSARSPVEWTLKGPFPERIAPVAHPTSGAWERALLPELAARGEPSGNLACAAREGAAYFLASGLPMQGDLLTFAAARCGAGFAAVWSGHFHGAVPANATDEELLAAWGEDLRAWIRGMGPADALGLSAAKSGTAAVVVVVLAQRAAAVEPLAVATGSATFDLKGEVNQPSERIYARINRGQHGVERCVSDPLVRPPRFSFRCEGDAADPLAWIEVGSTPPGRVLGKTAARVLVSPSGAGSAVFRRGRYSRASGPGDAGRAFAELVNEIRAAAGQKPLAYEVRQSQTVGRLARHYFGALESEDALVDRIALGVIAGWEVEGGVIRHGDFVSDATAGTTDLGELASSTLLYPWGRDQLLDPDASRIAAAALTDKEENGVGVLAGAYTMHVRRSPLEEGAQVMAQLNRARAMHGLAPAVWVESPGRSAEQAIEASEVRGDPNAGRDLLHRAAAEITGTGMISWTLHTWTLDEIDFPPEIVMTRELAVVLAVASYRAPDEPWGGFAVMLVLPEMANIKPIARAP